MPIMGEVIFQAYLSRMERRKRHPKALSNYARCYQVFQDWAADHGIEPPVITTDEMEDYFACLSGKYAPNTVRAHLKAMRSAYCYAQRRGVVGSDPTVEVVLPDLPDTEPTIIPIAELRSMQRDCRTARDLALFSLLAWTGMRRIEVCRLAWDDVNFKTATLRVNGKLGKMRYVPIHPRLAESLMELPFRLHEYVLPGRHGGQMALSTCDYRLRKLTIQQTHSFRRTVATSLYVNGVAGETIDKIMGWSPRTIRGRYYINVAAPETHAAILQLYRDDPL